MSALRSGHFPVINVILFIFKLETIVPRVILIESFCRAPNFGD
jgi:hypothetical protein